jgi:hypothetical protein
VDSSPSTTLISQASPTAQTSVKSSYQYTASEAAALAAVKGTAHQIIAGDEPGPVSHRAPKLSAAALSAAVFAAKPKESALSKAKMFARQATKPHSQSTGSRKKGVDLTIQTAIPLPPGRPSLSERSPLTRPSRELERIASIGSVATIVPTIPERGISEKSHKHHLSFRPRKDAHGLSSSSSNSKLVSEGSIYSFHPSSPGVVPAMELKNLGGTKEEHLQVLEGSWSLLRMRVVPLFAGEGLRVPVEDLNNLVVMHLGILVQQGGTARDIMTEFKELLRLGVYNLDANLQKADDNMLIHRLVETWMFFFNKVTPYVEAVFLPLQCEFQRCGRIIPAQDAGAFWKEVDEQEGPLEIRRFILMSFRDHVVVPMTDRLEGKKREADEDGDERSEPQVVVHCGAFVGLSEMRRGDFPQKKRRPHTNELLFSLVQAAIQDTSEGKPQGFCGSSARLRMV